MKRFAGFLLGMALLLSVAASAVRADDEEVAPESGGLRGPYPEVQASFVNGYGTGSGGEFGLAGRFIFDNRRVLSIGPRAVLLRNGEAAAGVEALLWFVNAIAPGIAVDGVVSGPFRLRVDPFLTARVRRFGDEGAWAVRVGGSYDANIGWAVKVGVTLQPFGVFNLGNMTRKIE